ncbi:MAG: inositol monophosphatase [Salinisphaeraceae bacterium]|nr:inositol monophosphatase [Salinisphaeraceae bacterium]
MQPFVNIAVRAARAAGRIIMQSYRQGDLGQVRAKGENDFVTQVDVAAEQAIIDVIRRAYPRHGFLAEESGRQGNEQTQWIIDPIDGTTNFIHGFPHFCVSIACEIKGELEHAVIYDPFKEELFTASRGSGAMLDGRRIRVSGAHHLRGALVATGFAYQRSHPLDRHIGEFTAVLEKTGDLRRAGSAALDLAYVACGRLDAFWERGLSPWDMAAGLLIVREAGGLATAPDGGAALDQGSVLAGTPKVYEALAPILAKR